MTRIGMYTLLRRDGSESLGTRWIAGDAKLGHLVEVSIVDPGVMQLRSPLIAALHAYPRHPSIPELREWFEPAGAQAGLEGLAIVLERVPGVRFGSVMRAGPAPAPIAARVVERVARVIVEAKLSPAAVMATIDSLRPIVVDPQGEPHLLLELAPDLEKQLAAIRPRFVAKRGYFSPEAVEGRPLSEQSTVFILGILLYHMSSGRQPFLRDNDFATLDSIRRADYARLVDVHPELERIAERALALSPQDRFSDAGAMADALDPLGADRAELRDFVYRRCPMQSEQEFDRSIGRDPELQLLRQIAGDPEQSEAYLVYADLLQSKGDSRGEQIAMNEPALSVTGAKLEWHHGFIRSARIGPSAWFEAIIDELAKSDSARFLRELTIEAQGDLGGAYFRLSHLRFPLTSLQIGGPTAEHRNVASLCAAFPELQRLTLRGARIELTPLVWPELRELAIETSSDTQELRRALDRSTLPKLEKLNLP